MATPDPEIFLPLSELLEKDPSPLWILLQFDYPATRRDYLNVFAETFEDYSGLVLEISEKQIVSLAELLTEQLPDSMYRDTAERRIVHIAGLESSFLEELVAGESKWVPQLETDKDRLSSEFPFVKVLWTDAYTVGRMEAEAPDFFSQFRLHLELTGEAPIKKADDNISNPSPGEQLIDEGKWQEGLKQVLATLSSEKVNTYGYERLRYRVGNLFFDRQKWELAAGFYRDVTGREETEDNRYWIARSYRALGATYANKGEFDAGLEAMETATEQLEVLEKYEDLGRAFYSMAQIHAGMQQISDAVQHYLYAAESFKEAGNFDMAGGQLNLAANIYEQKGKAAKAAELVTEAAGAYHEAENIHEEARCHQHLGMIYQKLEQWPQALAAFQAALGLAKQEENEFLVEAMEDSIQEAQSKIAPNPKPGKKGLFGKLFG